MNAREKKVLITDDVHISLLEGLSAIGYECHYLPHISLSETRAIVAQYHGLVVNSKIWVDAAFLSLAPKLAFVARLGSGMEIIDVVAAAERGVAVFSSPEGNRNAVAEHAMAMLLALANNLLRADREVRQFDWQREKNRGFELAGKTVGIVGFGHTGRSFAQKLSGWDVEVLAYDKYKTDYTADFLYVRAAAPDEICAQADIISFHLPLTAETKHLVDKNYLNKCKETVVILNTSRGAVVCTEHLLAALAAKKIGGACLDVFENEKVGTFSAAEKDLYAQLYRFENVVLSPHIAGWTHQSKWRLSEVLLEKIGAWHFAQTKK